MNEPDHHHHHGEDTVLHIRESDLYTAIPESDDMRANIKKRSTTSASSSLLEEDHEDDAHPQHQHKIMKRNDDAHGSLMMITRKNCYNDNKVATILSPNLELTL